VNREEAVLRELNLYPLWKRREQVAPVPVEVSVSVETNAMLEQAPSCDDRVVTAEPSITQQASSEINIPGRELAPTNVAASDSASPFSDLGWLELKIKVESCSACQLRATCTQTVLGVGDQQADWLFVGEAPGVNENARGEPFVGQAGRLLDNMLMATKLKRGNNVYICNVVRCCPPDNRSPEAGEIATCLPYLQRQIELIQPKLIVALGKVAANALLGGVATLASLRGEVHELRGIPLIITYHPAYLLIKPADKANAWQDLCLAVKTMEG